MQIITQRTKELIEKYEQWHRSLKAEENGAVIHVDDVISEVAKVYEKIREIVDWREKHLMRRVAIERILKRRLFLKTNSQDAAEPFVFELIRGGYFPNNKILKIKISEIQQIIDKYTYIINKAPNPPRGVNRSQLYVYLIGIAACEVEENLDPLFHVKENFLIEYMEADMKEKIVLSKEVLVTSGLSEIERDIQIFIAVQQALLKLDHPIISYYILKRYYAGWFDCSEEALVKKSQMIYDIWERVESSLNHPLSDKFYKICEQYDTPYLLIDDILSKDQSFSVENLSNPEMMKKNLEEVYKKRLSTLKSRMGRTAFYSTLSIFSTNIFSLYVIEIPFAKYVMGNINLYAAIFDILGPTMLMFLLVVTIRPPSKKNFELVLNEVEKIIYQTDKKDIYEIEIYPERSFVFKVLIKIIYLISFCLSFGLIIWVLQLFNFPPLSYLLLIIFTSLITYTGTKIRQRSRELDVTEKRGSVFNIIIDPISLPVVQFGKWLSARWKKINIIGVFFILLIDTPFLLFVEFLEQWRYFIKEKKEDIR